ncbi:unnamed protein product [Sphenostylis stenocarpa]|uniref:Elongin-A n=1 Tax=Sphenostylis stenocarpa TaxID=92480 RepID=A0AA86VHL8_9FABA|nr:unnamed protein product [Sphenostylis stenocarpa]
MYQQFHIETVSRRMLAFSRLRKIKAREPHAPECSSYLCRHFLSFSLHLHFADVSVSSFRSASVLIESVRKSKNSRSTFQSIAFLVIMMRRDEIYAPKMPTLVDLCVQKVIDNVRYLGNVGGVEQHLLERILPHCTVDQLMHVEKSTKGRDLSPVTDKLWKKFFEKQFGINSTNEVIKRMKEKKVSFRWMQLYEAKGKEMAQVENEALDRIKQLYKKEDARKQSRQVRPCTKVPPSSKRRFWGDNGPGYNVSNVKSNIMKKAKIEFMKR